MTQILKGQHYFEINQYIIFCIKINNFIKPRCHEVIHYFHMKFTFMYYIRYFTQLHEHLASTKTSPVLSWEVQNIQPYKVLM